MSTAAVQILLVEDDIADAVLMKKELAESPFGPFAITHVKRLSDAIARMESASFDAVMLDLGLPDSQGISTLQEMQKHTRRGIPIVVLTGLHDDALGLRALQDGAADYLTKGIAGESMRARALRYAIERKSADEASIVSQERLARAVDAARMGVFDWNLQTGEVVRIHNSKHLYGRPPYEMDPTYEGFNHCLHPDDRSAVHKRIQHSFAAHEDFHHECRTVWPDESLHWIEVRAKVFYDEHDRPVRVLGTVMDITGRKADEADAKIRDAEMAHLSRVTTIGQMASGLAHELNQPLAAILNYANICVRHFESDTTPAETARSAATEVMNETRRAGAIISRMRSFVRKQRPIIHALDINPLVRESLDLMDFELRHQQIRPDVWLADGLPRVMCDSVQIEQVLVNLIFNAMEAMNESHSGRNILAVETALRNDHVEVAITDSGAGMSSDTIKRMFEPFFTTKAKGLGMGLNISRTIIENHGGRLSGSQNPAGGMRFSFTLPTAEMEN